MDRAPRCGNSRRAGSVRSTSRSCLTNLMIVSVDPVLAYAQKSQARIIEFIREMVLCESPSGDAAAIGRFNDLFASRVGGLAKIRRVKGGAWGDHLLCEFALPGGRKKTPGMILGLGHSDTVYPMGALKTMPWRETAERLHGPGVLDMKAGLAFFVFAMEALRELDIPVVRKVVLQVNSEEEVGSPVSRALTEKNARASRAVLVLEPGTGLAGKLKTARKGAGRFEIRARGRAAHAGIDPEAGLSAILEISHQVQRLFALDDPGRGISVNVGTIDGGLRPNVVAPEAVAVVDVRAPSSADAARVEQAIRALTPVQHGVPLEVTGGFGRPAMERTPESAVLWETARDLGTAIDLQLEDVSVGGASDGNTTS
ncbi:MAG TPA: M20/M25/M40 family metallo-hydrolase, partial [Gemmatimonadaceae bacterium]|nr:M20/M25/M40 family metallo-hydrolase [Gemmatimonadaceae bacterium]